MIKFKNISLKNIYNSKTFKLIIILSCLYFIYNYFNNNREIAQIIRNINYNYISIILIFTIIFIFLYAQLIYVTLKEICFLNLKKKKWLLIYFNSQYLSSIPFFGIFYRAVQLKKFDLNYDKFVGVYFLINWFFLFITLFLISIESIFFLKTKYLFDFHISIFFITSSLIIFIVPIFFSILFKKFLNNSQLLNNYFISRFNKLINLILSSLYNKKFLKKFILLVLLIHILEFLILTQLVTTINEKIIFQESYIIFIGNILIDIVNFIPQNLIISEIGLGIITDKMNYNFELGILIKLYLRFIIFFASVFLAIIYNIYILIIEKEK